MARIAVVYDTTEGQTAKIAQSIAETATGAGHAVTMAPIRKLPQDFEVDEYAGILLGASIHMGKHSRPCTDFVRTHRHALEAIPSAFFSVSLSAAGTTDRQQGDARRCLEAFLSETSGTPRLTATIAGALKYREYGLLRRIVMKWIAGKEGGDTDTSQDYEYTDWNQVQAFVSDFLCAVDAES